jgi:hypothetical protein
MAACLNHWSLAQYVVEARGYMQIPLTKGVNCYALIVDGASYITIKGLHEHNTASQPLI